MARPRCVRPRDRAPTRVILRIACPPLKLTVSASLHAIPTKPSRRNNAAVLRCDLSCRCLVPRRQRYPI